MGTRGDNKRFLRFIGDYSAVSEWSERYDLDALLKKNGIVVIDDFLPEHVANGALRALENHSDWNETLSDRDYISNRLLSASHAEDNNISHRFVSSKASSDGTLQSILRIMSVLRPEAIPSFSAAKYVRGDHIEPHDDKAFVNVRMEDGSTAQCCRDIACILYLTKDWKEEDGGLFVDLENEAGPLRIVPRFNTMVAFRVPRMHEVTAVVGDRARYSIFGWFLSEGKLYELEKPPPGDAGRLKKRRGERLSAGVVKPKKSKRK